VDSTIPACVLRNAERPAARPAFWTRDHGRWVETTWEAYGRHVRRAARSLVAAGVAPGDAVALLGRNRPEWTVVCVGAMAAGAVAVGLPPEAAAPEIAAALERTAPAVVLVEDRAQWEKVATARSRLARPPGIVTMRGTEVPDGDTSSWRAFLEVGAALPEGAVAERLAASGPSTPATIVFSAGTTGTPRGTRLTHDNLLWAAGALRDRLGMSQEDRTLSYLPPSHVFEHLFAVDVPAVSGAGVAFGLSSGRVPRDLREIQPTVFFGTPEIWHGLARRARAEWRRRRGLQLRIAARAMEVNRTVVALRRRGAEPEGLLRLRHSLARRRFTGRARRALGLGELRVAVAGGGALAAEAVAALAGLDVWVHDLYGTTETTGVGTIDGRCPGGEIRLAPDGEILLRGRGVAAGGLDAPGPGEDGWLRSGDLGVWDEQGRLTVTGRRGDVLVTDGTPVSLRALEGRLESHDGIARAVIVTDGRGGLGVLVAADPDRADVTPRHVASVVASLNERLPAGARLGRVHVLDRVPSRERGEVTPLGEIRRHVVARHFAAEIEALLAG